MSPEGLACLRDAETGAGALVNGVDAVFAGDEIVTRPLAESPLFIRGVGGMVGGCHGR
jgi:hypothetical protein